MSWPHDDRGPAFSLPLPVARAVGEKVCAEVLDVTTARLVAGSARRGAERCRDLDVVLCPRFDADLGGGFAGWTKGFLDRVRECPLWDLSSSAKPTSRQITVRSKKEPRLKIELWLAFPWNFGWIATLRTGPSEFTQELVTLASMNRLSSAPLAPGAPGYRFCDGRMLFGGQPVRVPDEETLFAELGLPFIEPEHRTAAWLNAQAQAQAERFARERGGA